jgi:hypothetical protein
MDILRQAPGGEPPPGYPVFASFAVRCRGGEKNPSS